jgi:hypothetical protein
MAKGVSYCEQPGCAAEPTLVNASESVTSWQPWLSHPFTPQRSSHLIMLQLPSLRLLPGAGSWQ